MKIAIVLGTRPEIIKMSPVIRECKKRGLEHFILHTNQHYTSYLDSLFLEELELPHAKHNLGIGSGTHGDMTGRMLIKLESVLTKEMPDYVLVEGDTNTVLAGALSAVKLQIKVGHVEAGLRSYYRRMPEEINRIVADHVSNLLFAPTQNAADILRHEGIEKKKIVVTGNTIVDAVHQNLALSRKKSTILRKMRLTRKEYFLVTAHREENVDEKPRLRSLLQGLKSLQKKYQIPVIYPIHPRTVKRIEEFGYDTDGLHLLEPTGYLDFLQLMDNAKLVLTDSGGIQEETCIMQVPCVTLRDNTERPETLEVGSNTLGGVEPETIVSAVYKMLKVPTNWRNPFGDGEAAERIISIIKG